MIAAPAPHVASGKGFDASGIRYVPDGQANIKPHRLLPHQALSIGGKLVTTLGINIGNKAPHRQQRRQLPALRRASQRGVGGCCGASAKSN